MPKSSPNYVGDFNMEGKSSVGHGLDSTDNGVLVLFCCFLISSVKHTSTLIPVLNKDNCSTLPSENLDFSSCHKVLGIVTVNVQCNYLVFYLNVLTTSFYSSIS